MDVHFLINSSEGRRLAHIVLDIPDDHALHYRMDDIAFELNNHIQREQCFVTPETTIEFFRNGVSYINRVASEELVEKLELVGAKIDEVKEALKKAMAIIHTWNMYSNKKKKLKSGKTRTGQRVKIQ